MYTKHQSYALLVHVYPTTIVWILSHYCINVTILAMIVYLNSECELFNDFYGYLAYGKSANDKAIRFRGRV
jgi:hypothetical protein